MSGRDPGETRRGTGIATGWARPFAGLLAIIVPPLGVWLCRGWSLATAVSLVLTVCAVAVFTVYAGPGLALYGLACLHGAFAAPMAANRLGPVASLAALVVIAVGAVFLAEPSASPPANAEALARGARLASNCAACHRLGGPGRPDDIGPTLAGVFGRPAGSVEDFAFYSEAMIGFGQVWTPELMEAFLLDPSGVVPGTNMALGPMTPEEATEIVTYLGSLSGRE